MVLFSRLASKNFKKYCENYSNIVIRSYWYRKGYVPSSLEPGVYPYPKRQVPLCGQLPLKERLKEISTKPLDLSSLDPIDIGLPVERKTYTRLKKHTKNVELEAEARKRILKVPLDLIHSPNEDINAPMRHFLIAEHYDIYNSLYGPPHYFIPKIPFNVEYSYFINENDESGTIDLLKEDCVMQPVFMGNLISARIAMERPEIDLSHAPKDYLWTIVMSCPDEPVGLDDDLPPANEYIHWMMTNLQMKSDTQNVHGDEIIPYLPPLPYQGTGYHRYVFILYRQDCGTIDLSRWKKDNAKGDLRISRPFSTLEFYRELQSELTPSGMVFFQSIWDDSVRNYYRQTLDTLEPVFEIEWPEESPPPQEKFPVANSWVRSRRHPHGIPLIRERYGVHSDVSFDVYLDRYRDRKELFEEIVRERLKNEGNPLDVNESRRERFEYPAAIPMPSNMPSWWQKQEMQRRLRLNRWKHLEGHDG